jgi:hypothetical protein
MCRFGDAEAKANFLRRHPGYLGSEMNACVDICARIAPASPILPLRGLGTLNAGDGLRRKALVGESAILAMGQILFDGGDIPREEGLGFPDGIQDDGVDDRIILVNQAIPQPGRGSQRVG